MSDDDTYALDVAEETAQLAARPGKPTYDDLVACLAEYVAAYDRSRETMDPSHELRAIERARALLERVRG